MPIQTMPGVPAGGLKRVGQIHPTNDLVFRKGQNALGIAVELLTTHVPGAPVVDDQDQFVGFISEFDVLRALEAQRDLSRLTATDIGYHGERPYLRHRRHHDRRGRQDHGREAAAQSAGEPQRDRPLFHHPS